MSSSCWPLRFLVFSIFFPMVLFSWDSLLLKRIKQLEEKFEKAKKRKRDKRRTWNTNGHQIGANKQYSTLEKLWVSDGAGKKGHAKWPTSFCDKQVVLAGLLMDALRSSCEWGVGNPRYFARKSWPNYTIWIWPATCTSGRIVRARSVFHWSGLQKPSILWCISAGDWLLHTCSLDPWLPTLCHRAYEFC